MTRMPGIAVAALAALAVALIAPLSASAASYGPVTWAWGANFYGELGNGTYTESSVPVTAIAKKLNGVTAIAGGFDFSLALLEDGQVMSWGENFYGQLGRPAQFANNAKPLPVEGLRGVAAIAAGDDHSLALLKDGTVMAWGRNGEGQLGNGTYERSERPVEVKGLKEVTAIAGCGGLSQALLKDGTVMDWGNNEHGELGSGTTELSSDLPVEVKGLQEVIAIACDLALLKDGTVRAWGPNYVGELGNGTTENSNVPVGVIGLKEVAAIASGDLALLKDGTVMAWGSNRSGRLGDGSTSGPESCSGNPAPPCSTKPIEVQGLREVVAIASGNDDNLALLKDGTLRSWGGNEAGQLGDGSNTGSSVPVEVKGLKGVIAIAAGGLHNLALTRGPPSVAALQPKLGSVAGGTLVTIEGSGFSGATDVMFGSHEAVIKSSSEASIVVESPAGIGTGPVYVTVTTPYGTSPATGKRAKHAKFKYKRVN